MKKRFCVTAVYNIMYLIAVPCTAFALLCFLSMMLSVMYLSLAAVGNRRMLCCGAWCYVVTERTSTCAVQVLWSNLKVGGGSVLTCTPCHQDVGEKWLYGSI
jgi:hypothetical protein